MGIANGRVGKAFTCIIAVVFIPYIMTMVMNGRLRQDKDALRSVDTGKDVIIQRNGANMLIDVEEYLALILPGLVEPGSEDSILEAQVVALRTRIYYAMGEETVIDAKALGFIMYDESAYKKRWGEENYKKIQKRYEQAVINTVGKIQN